MMGPDTKLSVHIWTHSEDENCGHILGGLFLPFQLLHIHYFAIFFFVLNEIGTPG